MNDNAYLSNPKKPAMKDHALYKTMNTSKLLNEAIAAGNTDDIDKYNKAHKNAMKKLVGECPYCDPDWDDVPNLPEAMKGYEVPLGNPDPGNYINETRFIFNLYRALFMFMICDRRHFYYIYHLKAWEITILVLEIKFSTP